MVRILIERSSVQGGSLSQAIVIDIAAGKRMDMVRLIKSRIVRSCDVYFYKMSDELVSKR